MSGISLSKAIICLLAVWLLVIFLMTGPLSHSGESDEALAKRLTRASTQLNLLKKQNDELRSLLSNLKFDNLDSSTNNNEVIEALQNKLKKATDLLSKSENTADAQTKIEPSKEFELTRRRVMTGVQEIWYFMGAELHKLKQNSADPSVIKTLARLLEDGADRKRFILNDLRNLSSLDGLAEWRSREAKELEDIVQKRLYHLQNPKDCKTAKKVVCDLNKGCGYGCQVHHAIYCFVMAYGTQRTMILRSKGWKYNKDGWETVFKPVSDTCVDPTGATSSGWPGTEDTQVLQLPLVDALRSQPKFLPLAIPKDISERLIRLHGNPAAWWLGQLVKYMLRPQETLTAYLQEMSGKLGFKTPIVGVHVRRTDKVGTEAALHEIDEYMFHVEDYFRLLEVNGGKLERRVYLATDEPSVFYEAQKKYPKYTFVGDPAISQSAAVASRYSDSSLRGVILDIHLLSLSDYLVCTFSSQVCRLAYEIMQTLHADASTYYRSLDDIYYFGGQNAHSQVAMADHEPQTGSEISLRVGDVVGIAGNHWDGFSKGKNRRTGQEGLYPSYKAQELVDVFEMPNYPQD